MKTSSIFLIILSTYRMLEFWKHSSSMSYMVGSLKQRQNRELIFLLKSQTLKVISEHRFIEIAEIRSFTKFWLPTVLEIPMIAFEFITIHMMFFQTRVDLCFSSKLKEVLSRFSNQPMPTCMIQKYVLNRFAVVQNSKNHLESIETSLGMKIMDQHLLGGLLSSQIFL